MYCVCFSGSHAQGETLPPFTHLFPTQPSSPLSLPLFPHLFPSFPFLPVTHPPSAIIYPFSSHSLSPIHLFPLLNLSLPLPPFPFINPHSPHSSLFLLTHLLPTITPSFSPNSLPFSSSHPFPPSPAPFPNSLFPPSPIPIPS